MKKLAQQLNDLSSDPGTWNKSANKMLLKTFWSSKKNFDECRNIPKDFKSTRREFSDRNRYLSMSFFEEISNGETLIKDWLLYSTSKNLLVCAYCSLFSDPKNVSIFASRYGDWRNKQHIDNHPKSQEHISALSNFKNFQSANRVDKDNETKCQENQSYWMKVLLRIVETIKFLSERKLAFRGTEERIGSRNNGNYLGCLELIAKFDPFLKTHLNDHANKGHSHTSYLSKDICEEFIGILADKVAHVIVEEVKKAIYFSISADSTPDITHEDQMTVMLRYVLPDEKLFERFLKLIKIDSHKGNDLANELVTFLQDIGIDVKNCRGQSYDNASNMSGIYSGVQANITKHAPSADFVPCSAHSLNLVGHKSAECCDEASNFFAIVQSIYNFFSASTHRWKLLQDELKKHQCPKVKSRSDTRWSTDAAAVNALAKGYKHILKVLREFSTNGNEKAVTRSKARGIIKNMETFETAILCDVWADVLKTFNLTSKLLQKQDTELQTVVKLYKGLIKEVTTIRNIFDAYEESAKDKVPNHYH